MFNIQKKNTNRCYGIYVTVSLPMYLAKFLCQQKQLWGYQGQKLENFCGVSYKCVYKTDAVKCLNKSFIPTSLIFFSEKFINFAMKIWENLYVSKISFKIKVLKSMSNFLQTPETVSLMLMHFFMSLKQKVTGILIFYRHELFPNFEKLAKYPCDCSRKYFMLISVTKD